MVAMSVISGASGVEWLLSFFLQQNGISRFESIGLWESEEGGWVEGYQMGFRRR